MRKLDQPPRFRLRIVLFEMSEESSIGEGLQSRGVVSHDVGRSGDVEAAVAVAVRSLVLAG